MEIKSDSRKIKKGDTFIALKGPNNDGHDYINEAISNGASKVIAEHGLYACDTLIVKDTRAYLAKYLKKKYPEVLKLKLIGVTGTNGKTTTCFLIHQALNTQNHKCGYIGTIGFYIDKKIRELENTTPDLIELYELLDFCAKEGCEYVCMEVSSQALAMKRVEGLEFTYTVFTNLTQDHLDYHTTMENYALAKQELFHKLKSDGKAIVNIDDENYKYFLLEDNQNITYGFNPATYQVIDFEVSNLSKFKVKINDNISDYQSKLLGKHNIYNLLVTIIVLTEIGINEDDIQKFVLECQAPKGRMESVIFDGKIAIVDYAHTPDAVLNVLKTVNEFAKGRVITLIGCGGNRDKTKRPKMADIATNNSSYVIFTSDNPRMENPEDIISDMVQNLSNSNYEIIINRKEAIKKGIQMLEKNDILLLLGKGHETYQIIKDKKIHFDDLEEVLNNIRR